MEGDGEAVRPLASALVLLLPLGACITHVNGLLPVSPAPGAEVHSLTPTLEWEAFPEQGDPHVTEVVYDLRVLDGGGAEIYSRRGLPASSHTLEQALAPGMAYFWTVRVRFRWEARRRETQWTTVRSASGRPPTPEGPPPFLSFRTPVSIDEK